MSAVSGEVALYNSLGKYAMACITAESTFLTVASYKYSPVQWLFNEFLIVSASYKYSDSSSPIVFANLAAWRS